MLQSKYHHPFSANGKPDEFCGNKQISYFLPVIKINDLRSILHKLLRFIVCNR